MGVLRDNAGNAINDSNPLPVKAIGGGDAQPTDIQYVYRPQAFSASVGSLAAGASLYQNGFSGTQGSVSGGTATDGEKYKRISGFAVSDKAGEITILHSADGTNWYAGTVQAHAAGVPAFFDIIIYARYVRWRYKNTDASAPTWSAINGYLAAN